MAKTLGLSLYCIAIHCISLFGHTCIHVFRICRNDIISKHFSLYTTKNKEISKPSKLTEGYLKPIFCKAFILVDSVQISKYW